MCLTVVGGAIVEYPYEELGVLFSFMYFVRFIFLSSLVGYHRVVCIER